LAQTFQGVDVGSPTLPGSATVSGNTITIVGGGSDIWNKADQCYFYYTRMDGDFDLRVQLQEFTGPNTWSKAGIMVRKPVDSTSGPQADDPFINVIGTPANGQNGVTTQWRASRGDNANWNGWEAEKIAPNYPNCWLRMVRIGPAFYTYYSSDGQNWIHLYHIDTSKQSGFESFEGTVLVGLAVTAHNDSDPNGARAVFANLTFSEEPVLTVSGAPSGFTAALTELGSIKIQEVTEVKLNGQTAEADVSQQDRITQVIYRIEDPAQFLAPNSTNTVEVTVQLSTGDQRTLHDEFVVGSYTVIPEEWALAGATDPGMNVKVFQADPGSPTDWGNAQLQIQGDVIDPMTGQPAENMAFVETDTVDTVNWEQSPDFTDDDPTNDHFTPNDWIPGLPGFSMEGDSVDHVVVEVTCFLHLTPGLYRMGVNSDDGFRVSVAPGQPDALGITLGIHNGTRSASDTLFDFLVTKEGYYPFRLLWWENSGKASVEWFTVNLDTGEYILINDQNPLAIKAYRTASENKPHLVRMTPSIGMIGIPRDTPIEAEIEDGPSTQLDPNSVKVQINGEEVPASVSKIGSTTKIHCPPPEGKWPNGATVQVTITANDKTDPNFTYIWSWQFQCTREPLDKPPYIAIEPGLFAIEAENFHAITNRSNHAWTFLTDRPEYSGDGFMQALPDGGKPSSVTTQPEDQSPELIYRVQFDQPGIYYLWVRGLATGGNDDSVHAGIDGVATNIRIDGCGGFNPRNQWVWCGCIHNGTRATLEVPTAGEHTVHIWMREDGFRIDKIVLTTDESYVPSGTGPRNSRFVGDPLPPSVAITSPTAKQRITENTVTIQVEASDTHGRQIVKVEFYANGQLIGEDTEAPWEFTWTDVPPGYYELTAKVIDNEEDWNISKPVPILVGDNPLAVFVVGATDPMSPSDEAIAQHLRDLGFIVRVVLASASKPEDAEGADVIIVSSTVMSNAVADKYQKVSVPVVTWEQALQDNLLLTGDVEGQDRGSVSDQTDIQIINPNHPMAAGLPAGTVTVTTQPNTFCWGVPPPDAEIIAILADGQQHPCLYGVDKGKALIDGTPAPARRVFLFFTDGTYLLLTQEGRALFDAALSWAVNRELQPQELRFERVILEGTTLRLTWTGQGVLEEADEITGPWQEVTPQPTGNTYEVDVTQAPRKFYRLRR